MALGEKLPVQTDCFALNVILMLVGWLVGLGVKAVVVVVMVMWFALLDVVMKLFGFDVGNGVGGVVELVCMLISSTGLVTVFSAVMLRRVDASCVDTAELYSYPRPVFMG